MPPKKKQTNKKPAKHQNQKHRLFYCEATFFLSEEEIQPIQALTPKLHDNFAVASNEDRFLFRRVIVKACYVLCRIKVEAHSHDNNLFYG